MRTSKAYLVTSGIAFVFGIFMLPAGFPTLLSMFWLIAIMFFVVYLSFRILEMLSDIERENKATYEELEEIFVAKYGRKPRKKGHLAKAKYKRTVSKKPRKKKVKE